MTQPMVHGFYDEQTATFSYVVYEQAKSACAIIDPVLDYNPKSGHTSTTSADKIVDFVREHGLGVQWILETHAHADHLTAAPYLKATLGGKIAIGRPIEQVQKIFAALFNLGDDFATDGSQFDHLFQEGDRFLIGELAVTVLHLPGHTPADMAYHVAGLGVFIGDSLFPPEAGTARCDFPGGDAGLLYDSIQRILSMPDETQLFMCHDYPTQGRSPTHVTTVAEQRQSNIHVGNGVTRNNFIAMRNKRDQTLDVPNLMLPAIQVNIRAGQFPPAEDNGHRYLKIPLNLLKT